MCGSASVGGGNGGDGGDELENAGCRRCLMMGG